MAASRAWTVYSPAYRKKEMATLAVWIRAGQSGAVVGLAGAGKSNLLGFLSHRPEALPLDPQTKPVAMIPVDLNNLPAHNLATFYRVILRSFYEVRHRFDPTLQQTITTLYQENRAERDPFLPQSALRELLLLFQAQNTCVVLVLDRFDHFCEVATPPMLNTLRGLRDSFKETLCYIVGLRQEVAYLSDPASLGELYEILDTHVCWVGPMEEADARKVIIEETEAAPNPPAEEEIAHLLALTGGYPALLKATCHWWLATTRRPALKEWRTALLAQPTIQYRLEEIWTGLTQEEQLALSKAQKLQARAESLARDPKQSEKKQKAHVQEPEELRKQHHTALARLVAKGLCREEGESWRINGDLLMAYKAGAGRGRGTINLDETSGELYQGQTLLEGFEPLERAVLQFLIKHPRVKHTKSVLIDHAWPEEFVREGIMDENLYQVIKKLRQKIEPNPPSFCYIITWRGTPEGGYQFFPEGRPI